MLEQKPRPEPGTSGIRAAYKQSRKLFLAIVLLLVALTVVLVKNHQFWFGAEETPVADETSVESAPNTATHAPSALAAQDKKHVAAKGSTNPVVAEPTVIATGRAVLPPMDIEVVAGDKHRTVHPGSNSVTIEMPPDSGSEPAGSTTVKSTAQPGPATNAAELVRMSPDRAQAPQGAVDSFYPPLVTKMKVQGSVVLQAPSAPTVSSRRCECLAVPPFWCRRPEKRRASGNSSLIYRTGSRSRHTLRSS